MSAAIGGRRQSMTRHHYPRSSLYGDYLRAGFGLVVTAGPVLLVDLADPIAVLFAALAVLFAWFGARTAVRQMSWVEMSPEAIAVRGPFERHLPWRQLERVKLAYYAPRRSRDGGWLQLTLRGDAGRPIRVDSTLEDFDQVLAQVRSEVEAQALALDPTTASNFDALRAGVTPGAGAPAAAGAGLSWPADPRDRMRSR